MTYELHVLSNRSKRDAVSSAADDVFDVDVRRVLRNLAFSSSPLERSNALTPLNDIQSSPHVICIENILITGGQNGNVDLHPSEEA